MESTQSMIYKVTHYDADGNDMGEGRKLVTTPIPEDVERELTFMDGAVSAGAASYQVHLMTPREVKQHLKAEAKAARPDFLTSLARSTGLFDIINLIAYLDQQHTASEGA